MLGLLGLLGCQTETTEVAPDATAQDGWDDLILPLRDPVEVLTRISLDVRGVRPTIAEIEAVEADPSALDALTAEFLDDPRFGDRVMGLYAEVYLTEADSFIYLDATDFGLDSQADFLEAVGQEPLRILSHVATEDLPYTELVTADWTMANETLAAMWPVTWPTDGSGWEQVTYTDSRPDAGVLSTNSLWLRYTSTNSNANRKRANQVSRIFLCNDYLVREIEFDRDLDLLDSAAIEEAIQNNPACVNCHNSLDPLAAYFFGFWTYQNQSFVEVATYHPDRERLWDDYLGVSPAFYGDPASSLADLGGQLAADPRFVDCAVEQAFTLLLDRPVEVEDRNALSDHREAFLEGGLTFEALFTAITADPRYRAGDAVEADEGGGVPLKMVSNTLLESQVEGLTGFRWEYGDYAMMNSDIVGVRTLAGGVDGYTVTQNADAPNATILLVQERLAEAASYHLIATEGSLDPASRVVFTEVDLTAEPTEAELTAQLQRLQLLVFGKRVEADSDRIAANVELWQTLYDIEGDAPHAWWGLTSALLRDPDFLLY